MKKKTEDKDCKYIVYKHLNIDGEVIYVGLTTDLKRRMNQHKAEEVWKETYQVIYTELPNETQMKQYEEYYINLHKPKYNNKSIYDGKPAPLAEYKFEIYYTKIDKELSSVTNYSKLQKLFNELNNKYFDNKLLAYITYGGKILPSRSYKIDNEDAKIFFGNINKAPIKIPEIWANDQELMTLIISKMILLYGSQEGIKLTSNRYVYKNKKFKQICDKFNIKTVYTPINGWVINSVPNDIINLLKDFDIEKHDYYVKPDGLHKKTSSTRKYICLCCGNSFRATKSINVLCVDCNEQFVLDVNKNCRGILNEH